MLLEASKEQFLEYLGGKNSVCVLLYTNMCGTCERAKIMLSVVSETLKKEIIYLKINVNFNPSLIKEYNVTSIPSFLLLKEGDLVDQFYAFHSVTFLYDKITQFLC